MGIDDETDALDITMVKMGDARYAKKYGVNKMPALVYFRRKFPSIYRDNLFDEDTILEWLTSNRYKQLELGVFMYAIVSLAITFMCYTAFLLFGLKPKEPEEKGRVKNCDDEAETLDHGCVKPENPRVLDLSSSSLITLIPQINF